MPPKYMSFLEPAEQVIWMGKPLCKSWFAYGDAIYLPYTLFMGGFLLYCETLIVTYGAPVSIQLLGIALTAVASYLIVGRLVFRRYKMKRFTFLITNKRVIQWVDSKWLEPKSIELTAFDKMVKYIEPDGSGTLLFGAYHPTVLMRVNNGMEPFKPKMNRIVGFYQIEDAQKVYETIKALQEAEGPLNG